MGELELWPGEIDWFVGFPGNIEYADDDCRAVTPRRRTKARIIKIRK